MLDLDLGLLYDTKFFSKPEYVNSLAGQKEGKGKTPGSLLTIPYD